MESQCVGPWQLGIEAKQVMWLIPKSYSSNLHHWSDLNWFCYWNFEWKQYLHLQNNLQNCRLFGPLWEVRGGGTQDDIFFYLLSYATKYSVSHYSYISKKSCQQSWQCTTTFKCFRQIRILYTHYLPFSNLKTKNLFSVPSQAQGITIACFCHFQLSHLLLQSYDKLSFNEITKAGLSFWHKTRLR